MADYDALISRLGDTAHKYRKELLAVPLAQLSDYLQYMTLRVGVRGDETVGQLSTDAEIRPYTGQKNATDATDIALRTLTTYHGSVVKEFDPGQLASTVYGSAVSTDRSNTKMALAIAMEMAKVASNNLRKNIFTAVRKASGTTTADLFNGFSTILATEKTAGAIATSKGNLLDLGEVTASNVVDVLMDYYQGWSEELQEQETKLFVPFEIKNLYEKGYQADFGSAAFNQQYKKTFLEGTSNRCEIVPMSALAGTGRIIGTTKSNMLVGADQMSDSENVRMRVGDNPFAVQFVMEIYFGVQFESLAKQRICVGEYTRPA